MSAPELYTHGHHESVLRSHVWRTAENSAGYLLPHLHESDHLLDVGCGPGTIALDLARRMPSGQVLGVDTSDEAVRRARLAAEESGVGNATFAAGDAYEVSTCVDSVWDQRPSVVHAHQLLQHLADPVAALASMWTALSPGGLLAVRDADYSAMTWYPAVPELEDWLTLYLQVARANGGEPDAGRRLVSWARAAGLRDIQATASAWCFASVDERTWWGELWAERVTRSALARRAIELEVATEGDLTRISEGWRAWAAATDGWFSVLHGEVLCRR